jgi:tryptophan synthase alpha chain
MVKMKLRMGRIARKFNGLSGRNEGALIVYVTAGDPSTEATRSILDVIAKHADIVELGIPFSDPIADGPTIQAASERALEAGIKLNDVFDLVRGFRDSSSIPMVILTYYNIVFKRGIDRFMRELEEAGGDGIIIPDLPIEEAGEVLNSTRKHGIDLIPLVAPTSTPQRIKMISKTASGFIYLVSLLGVTGARERLSDLVGDLIKKVLEESEKEVPVVVGFGISKPEHVREVIAAGADGTIVGSAVVKIIGAYRDNDKRDEMLCEMEEFLTGMKAATKSGRIPTVDSKHGNRKSN